MCPTTRTGACVSTLTTARLPTVSAPVALDLVNNNPAATFGTGFAPFFLPLALFIGALIIWMLLTPCSLGRS